VADWKRTYWVVWAANLITSIGMMSFLPFFPSLLEEMGMRGEADVARWAGLCFAAAPLTATFSAPIWGAVGDRFGRKLMVCRSMIAIALFVGAMGFAQTPWQLLALRLAQGLFSGFIPPSITLVSVLAPADQQGRIAGNLTTALAIGALVGPLLGGLAVAVLGSHQRVFFVVAALAAFATLLVTFGAREDKSTWRKETQPEGPRAVLRVAFGDLREVAANPALRAMALLVFAMQFGLGALNPVMELHVRELFVGAEVEGTLLHRITGLVGSEGLTAHDRVEALATSLAFGVMAIASLVTLGLWGRFGDRIGHRRALFHCSAVCVGSLLFQAWAPLYGVLLLGRAAMGVGMSGIGPLAFGLAAGEASADRRGGAFGAVFSARTFAVAVGGIAGGWAYDYVGARGLMLVSAAVIVAAVIGFARRTPPHSGQLRHL
jgi:DHA1 family multidrug resistance protein-like MFS transporter